MCDIVMRKNILDSHGQVFLSFQIVPKSQCRLFRKWKREKRNLSQERFHALAYVTEDNELKDTHGAQQFQKYAVFIFAIRVGHVLRQILWQFCFMRYSDYNRVIHKLVCFFHRRSAVRSGKHHDLAIWTQFSAEKETFTRVGKMFADKKFPYLRRC